MLIATGKVIDGKVVVEGDLLDEGSTVTVLALEDEETFEVTADQETELLEALAQANRSEGIDGDEFLRQLSAE